MRVSPEDELEGAPLVEDEQQRRRSVEAQREGVITAADMKGDIPMTHPLIQIVGRHAWRDDILSTSKTILLKPYTSLNHPLPSSFQTHSYYALTLSAFDWPGVCVVFLFEGTTASVRMNGNGNLFNRAYIIHLNHLLFYHPMTAVTLLADFCMLPQAF